MVSPLIWSMVLFSWCQAAYYDSFTGKQISEAKYRQYEAMNLVPYCGIEVKECDENERRRLDYSCNNVHDPQRGTTLTPYRRMLPPDFDPLYRARPSSSGAPLPLARAVRTSVISDGRKASKRYTNMVPIGTVAITGDVTSVHDTSNYVAVTTTCCAPGGDADPRCAPIKVWNDMKSRVRAKLTSLTRSQRGTGGGPPTNVTLSPLEERVADVIGRDVGPNANVAQDPFLQVPDDDVHLRRSQVRCMNLTRPITYQDLGCVPANIPPERVNTSPPMLELSVLYGNDELNARRGKEGRGGRLKSEMVNGREWPPSGSPVCILNRRSRGETRCHASPTNTANIIVGANILVVWLYRLHNTIARELEKMNPCWDDERIYLETKEIVIAYTNHIWYYEMFPQLMGYEYLLKNNVIFDTWGHVNDYDPLKEPRVTIEYVIASRWFHTMQEGRLKTYDSKGNLLDELKSVDMTLRTGILATNRTIEGLTQGMFRQPCGEADYLIDPDMGERVLGPLQFASDVMSSDIMKGREAGLPPYNKYRNICNLPVAKKWDDLLYWMPEEQVDALRLNYETVEDVDIMAGILSEKPMKDAAIGPTLGCIMADQLRWWRQADRFWYENAQHPGAFTPEQLYEIKKIRMSRIICDYGDEVEEVQPWAFLVPAPGNEITNCKEHPAGPRLAPWRDHTCKVNFTPATSQYPHPHPQYGNMPVMGHTNAL